MHFIDPMGEPGLEVGECRRFPPSVRPDFTIPGVAVVAYMHPPVDASAWCGEWRGWDDPAGKRNGFAQFAEA